MPLQDSFGKKAAKTQAPPPPSRFKHLGQVPSQDDLREAMLMAMENMRQPVLLTWKRATGGPMYLLTVIRNSDTFDPTWILNTDDKNQITVHWSYTTPDPELVHSLITEKVLESAPAAVIPDSLRLSGDRMPAMSKDHEIVPTNKGEPQFFENYEIINTIGKGGMGIIYKAKDRKDGSTVALKVLKTELLVEKSNVDRFKHEASNVHSLKHPNLVSVREFGFSRFGQPFITMDYLEGVELKAVLEKQKQLDLPSFVNIFTQLCDALAYAHDKGLVHRDIKPGNIMMVKSPGGQDVVKIIDFGIAKSVSEGVPKFSSDTPSYNSTGGQFLGSPGYMSPEQCAGAALDKRSDIYSLGCVMYEAILGLLPFKHDNVIKTILAHVNDPPQSFQAVRPDLQIPEELEGIVLKCLEKDPEYRYQNARELCEDLWTFAAMGSGGTPARALPRPGDGQSPNRTSSELRSLSPQSNPVYPQGQNAPTPIGAVSTQMPAMRDQRQPQEQAPMPVPKPVSVPPPTPRSSAGKIPSFSMTRTVETGPMSQRAFSMLRFAGILPDEFMKVVANCEQMIDQGEITIDQAVEIIKHHMKQKGQ
jgi:serine/threonine-protein kinase